MNSKIFILAIATLFLTASCEDVLEKEPLGIMSDSQVWKDEKLVDAYLAHLYSITNFNEIFDIQSRLVVTTDEARTCFGWSSLLNTFTLGVINPDNIQNRDYVGFWEYNIIRGYNEFLHNIATSELSNEFVAQRSAEVRFLRALHYFNLAMRYGGVPIITEPQLMDDPGLFPSRDKEVEVYEFVRKELDDIIEVLPPSYNSSDVGRVSKYAALALKSRAMLYAGSIARYGSIQLDGILGVPQTEADHFFQEAYDASKAIIDDKKFNLFNKYPGDKAKNYQHLFMEKNNPEVILAKKYMGKDYGHPFDFQNQPISYKPFVASVINPTLEMVDSYEFIDGSPGSSVNYDQEISTRELFENKDPRFHATILYNEAFWIDDTVRTHYFTINSDISSDQRKNGPAFRGKDVNNNPNAGATQTGFMLKKYLQTDRGMPFNESSTDFIVFRLGEVYLNMAEAALELGNTPDALMGVNEIRERAGMPPHQTIDMDKIRHERKIELAFEGIRFWDVRRWRTAHAQLSGAFHKLAPYYIQSRNTFGYLIQNCQGSIERKFMEHHYYLPLERKHITENSNLVQNPGYN